ncbi:MAG: hypothetical protein QM638_01605, partial [Nocardioides sp.]|uniref:hypothetical protein n=1 Tax=Nocardioides sp. TaxID=35761 RepID=UPI0039E3CD97
MTPSSASSGYVGRRRAAGPVLAAEERPSGYVGKRRAITLDDEGYADPRVETAELQAILAAEFDQTAPTPRVSDPLALPAPDPSPTLKRLPLDAPAPVQRPDEALVIPAPRRSLDSDPALAESRIDLPRISVAATYASDLVAATDALAIPAPARSGDGARRSGRRTATARRRRPSLPLLAGAA